MRQEKSLTLKHRFSRLALLESIIGTSVKKIQQIIFFQLGDLEKNKHPLKMIILQVGWTRGFAP